MRPSGKPTSEEKRAYRQAEGRLRESILMREVHPGHSYPRHGEDLETMRAFHQAYGVPDAGLLARLKRLVGGGG